ncbi:MAG TPA: urea ABC transporter permease subunit UrtC, partial [Methylophilus sp.]
KAELAKKPEVSTSESDAHAVLTETIAETSMTTDAAGVAAKSTTRKKAGTAPAIDSHKMRGAEA